MDRQDGGPGADALGPANDERPRHQGRSRHRSRGPQRGTKGARLNDAPSSDSRQNESRPARPRSGVAGRGRTEDDGHVYAALDLGTNNCRLLVAHPTRRAFRVVDAFSRIVRLGEGVTHSGRLADEAMQRAVDALAVCRDKMMARGVTRRRLIATEACRIADNGEEFISRVQESTGLELEIVNRETEARLAVSGCASLVDPEAHSAIVFDIGGGSTELVLLTAGEAGFSSSLGVQRNVATWTSLPVGVVTISEKFGGRDVDRPLFEAMVAYVQDALAPFAAEVARLSAFDESGVHLLGTSGTVTTICGVHLGLDRYDRRRVDGTWMRRDDVIRVTDDLLSMDYDQRVGNPCIGADRADLVLAGCAIFEGIRRLWPCDRVRVADRGLREGILLTLMADDGVWRRGRRGGRRRGRGRRPQGRKPDGDKTP